MAELLKDYYDHSLIKSVAKAIKKNHTPFDESRFIDLTMKDDWESLELKPRMYRMADSLYHALPSNYGRSIDILVASVEDIPKGLTGLFLPAFVEMYGTDHWNDSMRAMEVFTVHSTAEFAIRPFILKDPVKAMSQLLRWTSSQNEHHRRLASEGCRPRLPWSPPIRAFIQDPTPIWPILEALKHDPSEYVRRSVANNLNDISKDHPEQVLQRAKAWWGKNDATDRLLKHGLRTLLKQPHPSALILVGYGSADDVDVKAWQANPQQVSIGGDIKLKFDLNVADFKGKLRLEYLIDFVKANGSVSQKVFQLMDREVGNEKMIQSERKHSFKDLSTRKHYAGEHQIHLRVNGAIKSTTTVQVK